MNHLKITVIELTSTFALTIRHDVIVAVYKNFVNKRLSHRLRIYQGPVVRKVDSANHRIVIFSRATERHKKQ